MVDFVLRTEAVTISAETLEGLGERLTKLAASYIQDKKLAIFEALGCELNECVKCSRPMLPRILWDKLPKDLRKQFWGHIGGEHSKNRCRTCVSYAGRNQSKTLSPEQLVQVRRRLGLIQ